MLIDGISTNLTRLCILYGWPEQEIARTASADALIEPGGWGQLIRELLILPRTIRISNPDVLIRKACFSF